MEKARHQRIVDLGRAQVPNQTIATIVGVHPRTVQRILAHFEDRGVIGRPPRGPPTNKKKTDDFMARLKELIEADPTKSMRSLASDLGCSAATIHSTVRELGMKSYVRRRRQLLTGAMKEKRLDRSKKLITWLKHHGSTVRIFSDKKIWTVDQARNSRNDRFLAFSVDKVPPIHQTKFPAGAMMLGVIASDGKRLPPIWFPKGTKVGTREYLDIMETKVKPWLEETYPRGNYVWQQDGAPSHTSKETQKWLVENLAASWEKTLWPPSSPDLNPLDYGIWGAVESKVGKVPYPSVEALKAAVDQEWEAMSEDFIQRVCAGFRRRLELCVEAKGSHFEK